MPLTTVRSPVTDIDQMSFGTTSVIIPSSGGPINVVVTGLSVLDFTSSTAIDVDDLVTLTANVFDTEVITLATSGGAEGDVHTEATLMSVGTTTGHPLELIANAITGLTIATDGKVELDIDGTAANHLIDKGYVDNLITTQASATQSSTGHITIPVSSGNDIIVNWGTEGALVDGGNVVVTFEEAFPNAIYVAFVTPTTSAHFDGTMDITLKGLTTMNLHSSLDKTTTLDWCAIGS